MIFIKQVVLWKSHECPCLCRLREQSLVKELRPRDVLESSSDSDEKVPVAKPSSLSKRKLDLEVETVEKKKKGRPRKDSRLMPMSLSMQVKPQVLAAPAPPESSGSAFLRTFVLTKGRAQGHLCSFSPPPP